MEMGRCSRCGPQPLDNFNIKNKATGKRQPLCRSCQNKNTRKWYKDNHAQQIRNVYARRRKYKAIIEEFVFSYLLEHPCVDCGERDILTLDFDHVRGTKVSHITKMMSLGRTLAAISAEISKCEVRCANCHRKQTAKRAQHARWKWCKRWESNPRCVAG